MISGVIGIHVASHIHLTIRTVLERDIDSAAQVVHDSLNRRDVLFFERAQMLAQLKHSVCDVGPHHHNRKKQ